METSSAMSKTPDSAEISPTQILVAVLFVSSLILLSSASGSMTIRTLSGPGADPDRIVVLDVENTPPSVLVTDYNGIVEREPYEFRCNCTEADLEDELRLTWLWGDESLSVTNCQSTGGSFDATEMHTYVGAGIYNLTIWIDDMTGLADHNVSDYGLIGVYGYPSWLHIVQFTVDDWSPVIGTPVVFTLNAQDGYLNGDVLSYELDFGDGEYAFTNLTEGIPLVVEHLYRTWGYFDAWATVSHGSKFVQDALEIDVVPMSFKMNLMTGWNQVSMPLLGWGYASNTLGLSFGDVVVRWDSMDQNYSNGFIVGLSPPNTAFAIEEGVGYWIYSTTAKTLTLQGMNLTEVHSYPWMVPGSGGWVMVGFPQAGATLWASDVLGMCDNPGAVIIVVRFNAATQTYQGYIPMFPLTDFPLISGEGLWVYLAESVTATYGP